MQCEDFISPWKQMNNTIKKLFTHALQNHFSEGMRKFLRQLSSSVVFLEMMNSSLKLISKFFEKI